MRGARVLLLACAGLAVVLGCQAHEGHARRNLRRDDAILNAMVLARLLEEQASDLSQVDIAVNQGVVSLQGEVMSKQHKQRLGRLIREIPGVRGVKNGLQIQPLGTQIQREGV